MSTIWFREAAEQRTGLSQLHWPFGWELAGHPMPWNIYPQSLPLNWQILSDCCEHQQSTSTIQISFLLTTISTILVDLHHHHKSSQAEIVGGCLSSLALQLLQNQYHSVDLVHPGPATPQLCKLCRATTMEPICQEQGSAVPTNSSSALHVLQSCHPSVKFWQQEPVDPNVWRSLQGPAIAPAAYSSARIAEPLSWSRSSQLGLAGHTTLSFWILHLF